MYKVYVQFAKKLKMSTAKFSAKNSLVEMGFDTFDDFYKDTVAAFKNSGTDRVLIAIDCGKGE